MWVPGSLAFLCRPRLIACAAARSGDACRPLSRSRAARGDRPWSPARRRARAFDLLRAPVVGAFLRWRYGRRVLQAAMLLLAALVVVVDGFIGPQVAPMNLAGVLPWTYWRGLAVLGLLAAGNVFCMACPFMLPRELGQAARLGQPALAALAAHKWLAAALLVAFFWAYEAFALWDSPWGTAWIALGYFAAAFVVDGLFRGASFCKYVCPIGQFHFVQSLVSPLEVKVREPDVCARCTTHDCIRGNAAQRGCELDLFLPRKVGQPRLHLLPRLRRRLPARQRRHPAGRAGGGLWRDPQRSSVGRFAERPDLAALTLVLFGPSPTRPAWSLRSKRTSSAQREGAGSLLRLQPSRRSPPRRRRLGARKGLVGRPGAFAEVFRRQAMTLCRSPSPCGRLTSSSTRHGGPVRADRFSSARPCQRTSAGSRHVSRAGDRVPRGSSSSCSTAAFC